MKKIFISLLALVSLNLWGQYSVGPETLKEIQEKFLDEHTLQVNVGKIETYKQQLLKRADEVATNVYNYELLKLGKTEKKASKQAIKNKYVKSINYFINEWLEKIPTNVDPAKLIDYLSQLIDLENAILIEITPYHSDRILYEALGNFLKRYKINYVPHPYHGEAHDLINPATGKYFSVTEIEQMKSAGIDISVFDPPEDNGVIEIIEDISKTNVYRRYRLGENRMHQGIMDGFPEENVGYFKEHRKSQLMQKVIFETKDENGNVTGEYKIKMGLEIHSEPTTGALGTAMGLYHDLSKHVKDFKLYIGDLTWDDFVIDFSSYFHYDDLERIVKEHGNDPVHGNYIVFHDGMLEARFESKELKRIGPYYPGQRKGHRADRGLLLFNIWVHNIDLKPGENNKTLVRTNEKGSELFYTQHDIGYSIGRFEREKPTDFTWDIVRKKTKKAIEFKFRSFVPTEGWDHVSFADGKWMVRKIAQLTREQITAAVKMGHWPNMAPYNYEQLIIEKLIARRNDLVEAFELVGEKLTNGNTIRLLDVDYEIEKEAISSKYPIEGYTSDFRPAVKYKYILPGLKGIGDAIIDAVASGTRGMQDILLDPAWFGIDSFGIIARAILNTDRQIIPNPEAKTESERYIVREDFRVGMRLGAGIMFTGDAGYAKHYTLIYTTSSPDKLDKHGKWVFDVTLPYRVLKNFLPKNHILITESYIEGRGRLRLEFPMLGPGGDNSISRVKLNRTVLSMKSDDKVTVYEDTTHYNQNWARLYMKLGLLRLKYFDSTLQSGELNREIYEINRKKMSSLQSYALDEAISNHDILTVKEFAKTKTLTADYTDRSNRFSLLGFVSNERNYNFGDIELMSFDKNGNLVKLEHQLDGRYERRSKWRTIMNGEERIARTRMSTMIDEKGELYKPFISLDFQHVDMNTTAQEIDNAYIPFFNGVAEDPNFIDFNAATHSYNQKYGHLNMNLKLQYYKQGIQNLLAMNEENYYQALSEITNVSPDILRGQVRKNERLITYQGVKYNLGRIKRVSKRIFDKIKTAASFGNSSAKIKRLLKAIVEAIPRKGHSQNPIFLATLNRVVGEDNYYLSAEIETPAGEEKENKMPGRITPFNSKGRERKFIDRDFAVLGMRDALILYHSL